MKKAFTILSVLFVGVALNAHAEQSVTIPTSANGKTAYVISMAVYNEAVYLLDGEGALHCLSGSDLSVKPLSLVNHSPEMEVVTPAMVAQTTGDSASEPPDWLIDDAKGIQMLFSAENLLYGLNSATGALYSISIHSDVAYMDGIVTLDLTNDSEDANEPYIYCGAMLNDRIILSISWDGGKTPHVCCFDIHSGMQKSLSINEFVPSMAAISDNSLVLIKRAENNEIVCEIDTVTLTEKEIINAASAHIDNLFYDAYYQRVILKRGDEIVGINTDGGTATLGYMNGISANCGVVLPEGLLIFTGKALLLCELIEGVHVPTPLVIATNIWGDPQFSFEELHPNIPLKQLSLMPCDIGPLFVEHMNIASSQVDIYELPLHPYLQDAIRKMYYTPLQGNPNIKNALASAYPYILDAMNIDNDIPALIAQIRQVNFSYSRSACEKMNIDSNTLPKTYEGFLDFCLDWEKQYGAQADALGICLFNYNPVLVKHILITTFEELYTGMMLNDSDKAEQNISAIASLLDKARLLEKQLPEPSEDPRMDDRWYVNAEPTYLFTLRGSILPDQRNYTVWRESVADFSPLLISMLPEEKPILLFSGSAYLINPYSKQQQTAQYYLNAYATSMSNTLQAQLFVGAAPVESQNYTILMNRYTRSISDLEARLKKAADADKRDIEVQIDQTNKSLKSLELVKWDISKESLDDYQQALNACEILWYDETVLPASLTLPLRDSFNNGDIDGEIYMQGVHSLLEKHLKELQ